MNVIEKLNSIQNKEMTAKENVENFIKVRIIKYFPRS